MDLDVAGDRPLAKWHTFTSCLGRAAAVSSLAAALGSCRAGAKTVDLGLCSSVRVRAFAGSHPWPTHPGISLDTSDWQHSYGRFDGGSRKTGCVECRADLQGALLVLSVLACLRCF